MSNKSISELFKQHNVEIEQISHHRRWWFYASLYMASSIILLVASWNWIIDLHSHYAWVGVIILIVVLSINWIYWTASIIHKFINHQRLELILISELATDIKHLKKEIQEFGKQTFDSIEK